MRLVDSKTPPKYGDIFEDKATGELFFYTGRKWIGLRNSMDIPDALKQEATDKDSDEQGVLAPFAGDIRLI